MAKRYELTADDLMAVSDGTRARERVLRGDPMRPEDSQALGSIAVLERKAGRPLTRNAYAMADAAGVREADGGPMGPAAARTAVERGAGTMAARELAGTGGDGTRAGSRMAPAIGKKWVNPLLAGQGGVYSGPIEEDTTPTIWPAITRGLTNPRDRPSVVNPMADAAGVREADGGPMGPAAASTAVERGAGMVAERELTGNGGDGTRAVTRAALPAAVPMIDDPMGPSVPIARIGGGRVSGDGSGEVTQGPMMERVRFNPMTMQEGVMRGIVDLADGPDRSPVMLETPSELGLVDRLRRGRDESMTMKSPAAARMAVAMGAERSAREAGQRMRAVGGNSQASQAARGEVARDAEVGREAARAEIRAGEARATPQAAAGAGGVATYDPRTGRWTTDTVTRGGPAAAEALTALDDREVLDGMVKYQRPEPAKYNQLPRTLQDEYDSEKDPAKRAAILQSYGGEDTEERKTARARYEEEARRRGLLGSGSGVDGGQAAGGGGQGLSAFLRKR